MPDRTFQKYWMKNRRVRIVSVETLHSDIPFAGYILSLPFQNATSKPQESSTHSNQNFNLLSPQHPFFSEFFNMTALVKITCWVDHSNLSRKSFSTSEEANFSRLEDPVGWGVCSSDDLMLPHQLQFNSLSRYWYIHNFFEGRYEIKVTDASPTGKLVGRKSYVSREKGPALLCFIQILTIVGKCMIILPCYSSIEILTNAYGITGTGLQCFHCARYIKGMLEDRLKAMIKPQCLGHVKTFPVGYLGSTILMEENPVK